MDATIRGFTDELLKIAAEPAGRHGKNYLRSALVGAAAVPLTSTVQALVNRKIHNHGIMKAMEAAHPLERAALAKKLKTGSLITKAELGGGAAAGGLGGSVVQWMRDSLA
jgi:hypothetical protein